MLADVTETSITLKNTLIVDRANCQSTLVCLAPHCSLSVFKRMSLLIFSLILTPNFWFCFHVHCIALPVLYAYFLSTFTSIAKSISFSYSFPCLFTGNFFPFISSRKITYRVISTHIRKMLVSVLKVIHPSPNTLTLFLLFAQILRMLFNTVLTPCSVTIRAVSIFIKVIKRLNTRGITSVTLFISIWNSLSTMYGVRTVTGTCYIIRIIHSCPVAIPFMAAFLANIAKTILTRFILAKFGERFFLRWGCMYCRFL